MQKTDVISFPNADALAQAAAATWLAEIAAAGDTYTVALSGGRITQNFLSAVVAGARAQNISFGPVHFFWADERYVAADSADSNFRLAEQLLFTPLSIGKNNIHRVRGEEPEEFACAEAEGEICRVATLNGEGLPMLDLVFLGLGEDGHVASLFPGQTEPAAEARFAYRAIADSPKPPPRRITLSYSAIAAAKQVWVLASGAGKKAALRESLRPDGKTPLARVLKSRAHTKILTDIRVS